MSTSSHGPSSGQPGAWAIMDPVRGRIRLAMLLAALATALSTGALVCLALSVSALAGGKDGAWPVMLAAGAATLFACVLRLAAFNTSHMAAFRLETVLRTQLASRLAQASLGYVQTQGASALGKVIHDDVKALHLFVADSTPLYVRTYLAPLLTFCVLLWLDWSLALAALGVLVFGFGVLALAMRNRQEMVQRYHAARERVSAAVVEYVQAMPVVRCFDSGHGTFSRYQQALGDYLAMLVEWYRQAGFSARFAMAILGPLPTLGLLICLGAWQIEHGSLAFGTWTAVLLLGTGMAEVMLPLMTLKHMIDRVKLSITRIQQVLDAPVLPVPAKPDAWPADAGLRFEKVSFRYDAHGPCALQDLDFEVPPGHVVALVGPSGSGKSTVARLITRFWDVSAGRILIGGVDIRMLPADLLMQQVACVFQENFLFAGSIAMNIRLGRPAAPMEDVVAAAKAAQAHEFIMALPRGYDTLAGELGAALSGGQRQRITIARALLQNRPILVLDEATAFADPENEAELLKALSALMQGRTVIMVAHRLSTIRQADRILVLDHGRLIESGTHATLVDHGGLYARLWRNHEAARNWHLQGQAVISSQDMKYE